jgi:two-component system, NtrC family, sensor kinase
MDSSSQRPALSERLLQERVKELECLFEISRVLRETGAGLEGMLEKIVEIVPRGFQRPERAGARIRIGARCRQTANFTESPLSLSVPISVQGEVGSLDVCYPAEMAGEGLQPFLPKEAMLVEKMAREISLAAATIRTAEQNSLLEAQLRHADRLATVGVLAAGIAHELNEPLSRILGFAQLAQKDSQLSPDAGRDLSRIVDASLHAREIVQKLLAFGRGAPARAEDCDMDALVAGAMDFLDPRFRSAGIEVRRELARRKVTVSADPTELRQVIFNLVINALQAMPDGGVLTIGVEEKDETCLLSVEDTGVGMTREVQERIFIPFFTTKDGARGTGLGLPVVHGIVTSLGGTISVHSRVGRGSRFTVQLPLSAAGAQGEAWP